GNFSREKHRTQHDANPDTQGKVAGEEGAHRLYKVAGQIFFVSRDEFASTFNYAEPVDRVTIDLSNAHLWDQGAVEVLDKAVQKFRRKGIDVTVVGLNEASATLLNRLATEDELVGS
ncbi:MAG: STAS domain-containing protein, partial [Cyanobacteria bacterium J06597_16]